MLEEKGLRRFMKIFQTCNYSSNRLKRIADGESSNLLALLTKKSYSTNLSNVQLFFVQLGQSKIWLRRAKDSASEKGH